jgi:hypothetical protein
MVSKQSFLNGEKAVLFSFTLGKKSKIWLEPVLKTPPKGLYFKGF